ncbi:MAG: exopolyphosphatase/guanosine-5'-triphosphate,3'-diphosphate pyrophosphatase, partial [Flavobacteriales bacterium]
MRVAIIDLGTNTFNLLIAEITDSAFKVIVKEKQAVKLGKSGLKEGQIMPDAFVRGVRAMVHYKNVIDQHQVTEIKAIATSAMRDSSNSGEFQQEVLKSTGIQIDIISGQEEASLIQKGVELTLPEG